MKDDTLILKTMPKGEILRKIAQRYPEMQSGAVEVFMNIKRVASEFGCASRECLEPYGLSEGKFYVLGHLFAEDLVEHEAPSPSEIAEHLGVTRATITGLLDGLERDGFVERHHDTSDRRSLTITMTDKARRFLDEYIPAQSLRFGTVMNALSESEKQSLIALLSKI